MSSNRRITLDVNKLINSSFKVNIENDDLNEITVEFPGPPETAYAGGVWLVRVELPINYPYSSPSVVFRTPIFHPNIDYQTGSVCLDVINQTWTPMFGLVNVFESFLPQLLAYPNASDPLNREAALLYNQSPQRYYAAIIKETLKYASISLKTSKAEPNESDEATPQVETDSDMSSLDELSDEE